MESLKNKAASWVGRVGRNDKVINTGLVVLFAALVARAFGNQKEIEALEAEKASLILSTKQMKNSMWSWKQSLFSLHSDSPPLVPLSRLRAIYDDTPKYD